MKPSCHWASLVYTNKISNSKSIKLCLTQILLNYFMLEWKRDTIIVHERESNNVVEATWKLTTCVRGGWKLSYRVDAIEMRNEVRQKLARQWGHAIARRWVV